MHPVENVPHAREPDASFWKTIVRHDFASSLVVFLVALPLCMGIAQASGVPIAAGIITGIVGGLVVGLLAGSPLQVSGPAAGLTVLVYGFVQEHGLPALGAAVLIAGAVQFAAGMLRLGQWFRAVSPAVIRGMLSGIGVLIFASQFHLMVDDRPRDGGVANLVSIPEAVAKGFRVPELGPFADRGLRNAHLHRLGGLHERQEEIRELVGERVAGAPSSEEAALERASLAPLVARQEDLSDDLKRFADEARGSELAVGTTAAGRKFSAALDRAVATSDDALAALRSGDLPRVRQEQEDAANALAGLLSSLKRHDWAAAMGLLTIGTVVLWQSVTPKRMRLLPGPLIAVLLTAVVAYWLSLPVLYVEVPDSLLDGVHFPSPTVLRDVPLTALLTGGLVFAAVASAETLLCATAVDQMHSGPRTRYDRELAAQGIGNMACGLLGGLPMTGVIVRSATNVQAGARTRASAVLHGVWLLLFVVALGGLLRYVPTSVLAGILVYTGYKLIDFKAFRDLRAYGRSEVGIYLATVAGIVVFDLLTGVVLGVALSALKLLVTFSRLKVRVDADADAGETVVVPVGAATFVRLPKLAAALERVPTGAKARVDLDGLTHLDHACAELLRNWARQYQATGGDVLMDWDALQPARRPHDKRRNGPTKSAAPRVERVAG
jgi:MFS superfamily sulfate permease-like transporter